MFSRLQHKITIVFLLLAQCALAQTNQLIINANLDPANHSIQVEQHIVYTNNSQVTLKQVILLDWANSFSKKTTDLGLRFAENFNNAFYFEKDENRGRTDIISITDKGGSTLRYRRPKDDLIAVELPIELAPGAQIELVAEYTVIIPDDRFTRYGYNNQNNISLRYWYLAPAVYKEGWQAYSNKNLDDFYSEPAHYKISLTAPKNYNVITSLSKVSVSNSATNSTTLLTGDSRNQVSLYVTKQYEFESVVTDEFEVITNLDDNNISPPLKAINVDRIVQFLKYYLGKYPFDKMVISRQDYKQSPVYGLNQLPAFVRPFPDGFQYDIEQLKTITAKYLKTTLGLNPRTDHWLIGAIQVYLMMEYTDLYYPDMKLIGNLSNLWIIKWSHISTREFNDQYPFLYMNMARNNLDQAMTTSRDSLVKFNKNIATSYKAGVGLRYLDSYLGEGIIDKTIKEFYAQNKLTMGDSKAFKTILKEKTSLPVDWFFDEYVATNKKIDFKIRRVRRVGDSLQVTIKNKRNNGMPVSLYGLKKDSIVYKTWVTRVDSSKTITIPADQINRLSVNYEGEIPEFNNRNNYKKLNGLFNKPVQFRLFLDAEDPKYNQLFFMPVFGYNIYDGFSLGPKLYNKTILRKNWNYKIEPRYALRSKQLVGSASIVYTEDIENESLYRMRYGFSGSTSSYNTDLNFRKYTPFISFAFRDPKDLRSNMRQSISIRNVNVDRDEDPNIPLETPNYSVFNLGYSYSDNNLIDFYKASMSYEISEKFSKIATTLEYRKLFINNRQLNVRLFAGAFLFNDTNTNDDFFSFALDRPTDYLFDYNYYGRSEDSGVFSQQIIIAEGGFKSRLEPAFANSWITTINASTNIWNWIYAYGDAGLVHNKGQGTKGVYDAGIRLSLVADYFELFFPIYSNNGWEFGLPNYDQRIRFIVTLSPRTLLSLFTREWY